MIPKTATISLFLFAMALVGFGTAIASDVETQAPKNDEAFVFPQTDRRDPFTFRQKIEIQVTKTPYDPPPPPPIDNFNPIATRLKLAQTYDRAENAFLNAQLNETQQACDEGLSLLQSIPQNRRGEFGSEQTAILRLRTAAERQIVRAEAQRQFEALNISLTGVVARTGLSQAIVNAKVVTRGEIVPLENAPQSVLVHEIRQSEVIFLYRGFRMPVVIKEGADR